MATFYDCTRHAHPGERILVHHTTRECPLCVAEREKEVYERELKEARVRIDELTEELQDERRKERDDR